MNFMEKEKPIGVFDSGIGGLTVVKRIASALPNESIVYFGDTARVPYGSKSNETVIEYSIHDAEFLMEKNVKAIVVACNTASSVAIPELKKRYNVPIIGMIEAGSRLALKKSSRRKIGVIGTRATIANKAYSNFLNSLDSSIETYETSCPLFVPLAEEGWINHRATFEIAEEYLHTLREAKIDTLILGCTHYPILTEVIQKVIGAEVQLIDSGVAAAEVVRNELERIGLQTNSSTLGNQSFYVSDIPSTFKRVAESFLGKEVNHVERIDIEKYKFIHK